MERALGYHQLQLFEEHRRHCDPFDQTGTVMEINIVRTNDSRGRKPNVNTFTPRSAQGVVLKNPEVPGTTTFFSFLFFGKRRPLSNNNNNNNFILPLQSTRDEMT